MSRRPFEVLPCTVEKMSRLGFWQRLTGGPSPEDDEAEAQRRLIERELSIQQQSPRPASPVTGVAIDPGTRSVTQRGSPLSLEPAETRDSRMPTQRIYI